MSESRSTPPRDPAASPESDRPAHDRGHASASARALDELRRAAQAADSLYANATTVLGLELDRAGRSLGQGAWTGMRATLLMGATLLAAVAGGVLVCLGATGLLASSLQLGRDATLLLQGSALLAGAALATGAAWLVRRRRLAARQARRRAAREALASSAADLADAVKHAADPRPWLQEHPLAALAAALVAGLAAAGAVGVRHARKSRGASPEPPPAPPAPGGPAENRATAASELAALVLSLGVPLLERLIEGDEPHDDTHG
jgi:hypothetical protein